MKELQKKYILNSLFCLLIILIFHMILNYFLIGIPSFNKILLSFLIFHIFILAVVFYLKIEHIQKTIPIYFCILLTGLYFIVAGSWKHMSIVFVWFFVGLFAIKFFFSLKNIIKWLIFSSLLAVLALITPKEYTIDLLPIIINNKVKFWINISTIITSSSFITFLIYLEYNISEKKIPTEIIKNEYDDKQNFKNYDEIFLKIEKYIHENSPWKNPDFGLEDLSYAINSNNTYVSKAINTCTGMSFKIFINRYRIEYIKNELNNSDSYSKYTMAYLYTNAGFRQQTTFNKAFKFFEKITPSEYINKIKLSK